MTEIKPEKKDETQKRRIPLAILSTLLLPIIIGVLVRNNWLLQVQQSFAPLSNWIYDTPTITLWQGAFVGKTLKSDNHLRSIQVWLGIPYAEAPIGDLRFARPVPVSASNETYSAKEFGFRCPGRQLLKIDGVPDLEASEDCLTVNVFRQTGRLSTKKLPVMVYLHGGAFNRGFAAMHDTASMLAWSTEPFVAVSFNYRISALGFLNSKLTEEEGILNLGLHDQILLLQWVQENIAAFDGDESDVTLVGLSAGAHSMGHHIMNINHKSELFHKAVIESGGHTSRAVHPAMSALHESQFRQFVQEVGCAEKPDDQIIPCLRAAPADQIIAGQLTVFERYNPSVRWAWQPVIDGDIISRRPIDAWKSGQWHKMPILTGFNHNEGTMYVPKKMERSEEFTGFFATLLPQLSQSDVSKLEKLYPDPATDPKSPFLDTRNLSELNIGLQFKRVQEAYGHYAYVCPVRQTANFGSAGQSAPVYLYHWALNSTVLGGANHADQMWYETMTPKVRGVSETHEEIARSFHAYVTSFIVSGDPNKISGRAPERPLWRTFRAAGEYGETMLFGASNDEAAGGVAIGTVAECVPDRWAVEQCDFWWAKSEVPED